MNIGQTMYNQIKALFPICRSLTGKGVRETLSYISEHISGLNIHAIPSGTQVFDWVVPKEWEIISAYFAENNRKVVDFNDNNLHVMGYSTPVDASMSFDELNEHLYSLSDIPEAIPYVTSYYKERWGFCMADSMRRKLDKSATYQVKIDSRLFDGVLNYADVVIAGESQDEILLSTYICHPSMANNELSGPVIAMSIADYIRQQPRHYTYRLLFLPESIGAIAYLSKNLEHLKRHVRAGFILTCLGDDRAYSYLASRYGNTLADRVAKHVLKHIGDYKSYSYLDRGSDERQFCAPGVDLPICSIMRSKYGEYPEYHTSLDNLELVSSSGLEGGYNAVKSCIDVLEANFTYVNTVLCEPQLGKRGLYPTLSTKDSGLSVRQMMNLLAYADGSNDLLGIAEITGDYVGDLAILARVLEKNNLLRR